MKPLTLDKALVLYDLIGDYIPSVEDDDALDFIGTIISNIRQSGNHSAYTDAVSLMSGMKVEDLLKLDYTKVLDLFVKGLAENRVISLRDFCVRIGYRHG